MVAFPCPCNNGGADFVDNVPCEGGGLCVHFQLEETSPAENMHLYSTETEEGINKRGVSHPPCMRDR